MDLRPRDFADELRLEPPVENSRCQTVRRVGKGAQNNVRPHHTPGRVRRAHAVRPLDSADRVGTALRCSCGESSDCDRAHSPVEDGA